MELPPRTLSVTCTVLSPRELDALVVHQLDVHVLAGNSFMVQNDISVHPAKRQIVIGGTEAIHYGTSSRHIAQPAVRRTHSSRNPHRTVVLTGDNLQLNKSSDADPDSLWTLEPRLDCPSNILSKEQGA